MKELFGKKWFLIAEFFYLILIPVAFFPSSLIPWRHYIMAGSLFYVWATAKIAGLSRERMGLRKAGFREGMKEIMPLSILISGILVTLGLFKVRWGEFPEIAGMGLWWERIGFYVFISVPLQGILFRSWYIARSELVLKNKSTLIWWSAMVFTLIHVPFGNIWLDVATLLFGLWSAKVFLKCRNTWAIMVAHGMVGGAEILRQLLLG